MSWRKRKKSKIESNNKNKSPIQVVWFMLTFLFSISFCCFQIMPKVVMNVPNTTTGVTIMEQEFSLENTSLLCAEDLNIQLLNPDFVTKQGVIIGTYGNSSQDAVIEGFSVVDGIQLCQGEKVFFNLKRFLPNLFEDGIQYGTALIRAEYKNFNSQNKLLAMANAALPKHQKKYYVKSFENGRLWRIVSENEIRKWGKS